MLPADAHEGAHSGSNNGGGPMMVTDARRNNNETSLEKPHSCSGEDDLVQDRYGYKSNSRQSQVLSQTTGGRRRIKMGGVRRWETRQPTKEEGRDERWRRDEWWRPRRGTRRWRG